MDVSMQAVCERSAGRLSGSLGCFVVDTTRSEVVAAAWPEDSTLTAEATRMVAVMCSELCGPGSGSQDGGVMPIGISKAHEAQVSANSVNFFMAALPQWPDGLVVLVTDIFVHIGQGWMVAREAVSSLAEATGAPTESAELVAHGMQARESGAWRPQPTQPAPAAAVEEAPAAAPAPSKEPDPDRLGSRRRLF